MIVRVFFIISLLTFAIILIIRTMLKKVTELLHRFKAIANRISQDQLDSTFVFEGNQEIIDLSVALHEMQDRIKFQKEKIHQQLLKTEERNRVIHDKKEEIQVLYEETSAMNEELEHYVKRQHEDYMETVVAFANAIEANDVYMRGHCERVLEVSRKIAMVLGIHGRELEQLEYAAILHDIGKIGVKTQILNKPGSLTDNEYDEIKKHSQYGYDILKDVDFLRESAECIYQHHERMDGKGYPRGIAGQDICLAARILCVADAYDAMTSDRPYRKHSLTEQEAIEQLLKGRGSQFDEKLVDIIVDLIKETM